MIRWMSLVITILVYIMPNVNLKSPFAIMLDEHESGSNTDVLEHFSVADSRRVAIRQGSQQVRRYTSDPGIVREKKRSSLAHPLG